MSHTGWAERVETLSADVGRAVDRMRTLSEARLAAPVPGHASRADGGRATAQALADVAAGLEAAYAGCAARWRDLPRLGDLAVGDQLAVTGHDAVAALGGVADPDLPVSSRVGPGVTAAGLLGTARAAVDDLRRHL